MITWLKFCISCLRVAIALNLLKREFLLVKFLHSNWNDLSREKPLLFQVNSGIFTFGNKSNLSRPWFNLYKLSANFAKLDGT